MLRDGALDVAANMAKLAIVAGLLLLLASPFIGALGFYAYYQINGRILPGVRAGETRVGGLTVYDAAVRLNSDWNLERDIVVGVLSGEQIQTLPVAPADLGLALDSLGTAQNAHEVGHGQDFFSEVSQLYTSASSGWEVPLEVDFDPQAARSGLESIAALVDEPAQDANLRIEGGELVEVPARAGLALDVEAALARIEADPLGVFLNGALPLVLDPVEPRVHDVAGAREQAEALLSRQVRVRAYDPISDQDLEWDVPRATLGEWLSVEPGEDGPQVALEQARVSEYLAGRSAELGAGRYLDAEGDAAALAQAIAQGDDLTIRVRHHPTTYTVESGDTLLKISWRVGIPLWRILEANPGMDPENLWAGREINIPSVDDMLPFPVIPDKRIVISIEDQRMRVYRNGELRSEHVISTGIDRSPTQPGVFQVQTHDREAYASVWDLYMPDFIGIYEAWPGFMNGLHGLPTLSSGRRLWEGVLGRPVSYGCIVLDLETSAWLYDWAERGVVVEIQP